MLQRVMDATLHAPRSADLITPEDRRPGPMTAPTLTSAHVIRPLTPEGGPPISLPSPERADDHPLLLFVLQLLVEYLQF